MRSPEYPRAHRYVVTAPEGDATMTDDYGKISGEAVARVTETSEVVIFWDLVIAIIVVVIGMIKGML